MQGDCKLVTVAAVKMTTTVNVMLLLLQIKNKFIRASRGYGRVRHATRCALVAPAAAAAARCKSFLEEGKTAIVMA
jgi:hypothetical protein